MDGSLKGKEKIKSGEKLQKSGPECDDHEVPSNDRPSNQERKKKKDKKSKGTKRRLKEKEKPNSRELKKKNSDLFAKLTKAVDKLIAPKKPEKKRSKRDLDREKEKEIEKGSTKKKSKTHAEDVEGCIDSKIPQTQVITKKPPNKDEEPSPKVPDPKVPEPEPEALKNLEVIRKFVEDILQIEQKEKGVGAFYVQCLLRNQIQNLNYTSCNANKNKNRTNDLICLEESRVKLKNPKQGGTDYIHASRVKFSGLKKEYILTQHPLPNTIEDFWNVAFHENVETVISLTNVLTPPNMNPPDYPAFFPFEKESYNNLGDFFLSCKLVKVPKNKYCPIEYNLEVLPNACSQSNNLKILQYKFWGRNLMPASPKVIMALLKALNAKKSNGPIMVQCESGIHQSSVVVFVDAIYTTLEENRPVMLEKMLTELRFQRFGIFPSKSHFIYTIHVVLMMLRIKLTVTKQGADILKNVEIISQTLSGDCLKEHSTEPHELHALSPDYAELA